MKTEARNQEAGSGLTPELERAVAGLVHTSVDDCRISLLNTTNARVLNAARALAFELGQKTRVNLIDRRIRQLRRCA